MDQPLPGAILGHYKIIRRLGAGGMGVVYEAEDLKLGRHVAIKLLSAAGDPAALDRFWREARAVSALNHPGICTLYEINETEQQPFLVMELLEGQSLERHQGKAVPLNRLIELGIQVADALDTAHHKGILHRDVKPANIFITKTGQVKILDFGLARFEETSSDTTDTGLSARHMITAPGSTLGTIAYMSPEQARGEVLDARSDVFSLGVVLYEMGTGKHPFNGTTTAIVFDKLLNYVPPDPASLNDALSPQFAMILAKALEKDRNLRYQSAADLRADLWQLQQRSTPGTPAASPSLPEGSAPQYEDNTRVSTGGVAVATAPAATAVSSEHTSNPLTAFDSAPAIPSIVAALREAAPAPAPSKPPSRRSALPFSLPVSVPLSPKHIRQIIVAAVILAVVIIAVALRLHHRPRPKPSAPVAVAVAPAPPPVVAPTSPAPGTSAPPAALPAVKATAPKEKPKPSAAHLTTQEANTAPAQSPTANPAQQGPPLSTAVPSSSTTATSNTLGAGGSALAPGPGKPATPPAAASAPAFATVSYPAHHEHAFPYLDGRSCFGTLQLSASQLIFASKTHPISLTRDDVTAIDGNGIIDTAGKRYRFQIDGMSKEQVHALLAKWFAAGQAAQPTN